MGIVTWASLKCEVNATVHKLYFVPAKKAEELSDFVYRVIRFRFSNELMIINGSYLAALLGESTKQVCGLMAELPPWVALVGISGGEILPEERVEAQEQDIAEIAQQFGLKMVPALNGAKGNRVLDRILNPSGEKSWKETYRGAFQDIFFTTPLDQTPRFIEKMVSLAEEAGYPAKDIGVYIQPQHMGTCYHCEFSIPYDPEKKKEEDRAKKLFYRASEAFSSMGAYYLRPHGIWARLQLNKDVQSATLLKKMKGIFDPNNIMNTGKLSV
jgi:FAD/FMN-containing dehydrogenase